MLEGEEVGDDGCVGVDWVLDCDDKSPLPGVSGGVTG